MKNLKLAFAVALGGTSPNENLLATPLVDDGFMYMVNAWGVVYKIDLRSGTMGRILWKMIRARRRWIATAASRCGAISSSPYQP